MVWPSTFVFLLPSHLFAVTVRPITPTESVEEAVLMVHPMAMGDTARVNELFKFYDEVNLEDVAVCERVQRGHDSDVYVKGTLNDAETLVKYFQRRYMNTV